MSSPRLTKHTITLDLWVYQEREMIPEQVAWAFNEWLMGQNVLPEWADSAAATGWDAA
jgi:hypothetical protein